MAGGLGGGACNVHVAIPRHVGMGEWACAVVFGVASREVGVWGARCVGVARFGTLGGAGVAAHRRGRACPLWYPRAVCT